MDVASISGAERRCWIGELGKTRAARLCLLGCRDGDEPFKPQQDSRSRGALSR